MENIKYLIQQFNKYNIQLTDDQIDKFVKYYELVIKTNESMNLTAITDWNDFVNKHFVDSCLPVNLFPKNSTVVDIGSGAGFPGIPLKILRPDLKITLVDSLDKRVKFLNKAIFELGLTNIDAIHKRAEEMANVSRETFDVVTARAVAAMNTLSEYCLPLCKVGGKFIAFKGTLENEMEESKVAIELLGGKLDNVYNYNFEEYTRNIVVINKVKNTPLKYPRGQNKPRTSPLK